jgi:iron complex outermembrane receptor protein
MSIFSLRRLRAFVPTAMTAFAAAQVHADTASADTTLPAVSVSANSAANESVAPRAVDPNLPASVETVTRDQFSNWNVVNTEDVLKYMPNLAVRKRFIGDLNSIIAVRGTSNTQSARGLRAGRWCLPTRSSRSM